MIVVLKNNVAEEKRENLISWLKELGVDMCEFVALFVSNYEISVSSDGVHFTPCAKGQLRVFSGEEIVSFAPQKARYIRFRAINTTGAEWRKAYADRPLQIAELSVFA